MEVGCVGSSGVRASVFGLWCVFVYSGISFLVACFPCVGFCVFVVVACGCAVHVQHVAVFLSCGVWLVRCSSESACMGVPLLVPVNVSVSFF